MKHGIGSTTQQIKNAPIGAVFVWVDSDLHYPRRLAESLGRTDLRILSPSSVGRGVLRGLRAPEVVVDHMADLTEEQWYEVAVANLNKASE